METASIAAVVMTTALILVPCAAVPVTFGLGIEEVPPPANPALALGQPYKSVGVKNEQQLHVATAGKWGSEKANGADVSETERIMNLDPAQLVYAVPVPSGQDLLASRHPSVALIADTNKQEQTRKTEVPVSTTTKTSKDRQPQATVTPPNQTPGSILILSVSLGNGKSYCDLTEDNHKEYAARHGYSYKRYHSIEELQLKPTESPKWGKLIALSNNIGNNTHNWVMWLDCDTVVTDKEKRLEEIVSKYSTVSTDFIIARDARYKDNEYFRVNTGVFLFRDNDWSKGLTETVISKGKIPGTLLEDQPRFCHELIERGELDREPKSVEERHTHSSIIPQRVMNSFLRGGNNYYDQDPPDTRWQKGDFIAHVTGMPDDRRRKWINHVVAGKDPREESASSLVQSRLAEALLVDASAEARAGILTDDMVRQVDNAMREDIIRALVSGDFDKALSLA